MKLYLAVAVLLLALASLAEAQDTDRTIGDHFTEFGEDVSRISSDLAEKAKSTFADIQDSTFVTESGSWFRRQFEKVKETFGN